MKKARHLKALLEELIESDDYVKGLIEPSKFATKEYMENTKNNIVFLKAQIKRVYDIDIDALESKGEVLCPVCRKYKFEEVANYEICEICMWENDGSELEDDGMFGPNHMTVSEYRKEYELKKRKK